MRHYFSRPLDRGRLLPLFAGVFFSVFALAPWPWHNAVDDFFITQYFRLRGSRELAGEFALVAIAPQDIQTLGGWPLTRDYYGYVLHFLGSRGARVIAFDLLWDQPHARYPEHDATFSNLLALHPRVCLPMVFSRFENAATPLPDSMKYPAHVFIGDAPVLPLPEFRNHAAGMGFSNLAGTPVPRQVPLLAVYQDSLVLSFGAELARLFLRGSQAAEIKRHKLLLFDSSHAAREIPLDDFGRLRLNHFGAWNDLNVISFVDLLHLAQNRPDSVDWRGKLVLVAVTDPTLTTVKATPFSPHLPAALIHLTAAENIVQQNYLREIGGAEHSAIILALAAAMTLLAAVPPFRVVLLATCGLMAAYAALALLAFARMNIVLPLFYPVLTCCAALGAIHAVRQLRQRGLEAAQRQMLRDEIALKQAQVEEAQTLLEETQNRLLRQEADSEKQRRFAEEQRQRVVTLEKQLRDLQTYEIAATDLQAAEFAEIIYAAGGAMAEVLDLVKKVAGDDLAVLICGETGAGKELIARAIHRASARQHRPFVAINCSALPESLLESELFGHEKGSFTGAQAQRRGRFELADGGTLFLDEITETSPALQARLLRVLQDGTFERVGGEHTVKTEVRIIAACNRDIQNEIAAQRFRADLFYRLNGFQITVPPLRQRREDIPLLARHFLQKHGYQKVKNFSAAAMAALQDYAWPGNVRELENTVRRAAVLAQSEGRSTVQEHHLPQDLLAPPKAAAPPIPYRALPEQILETLRALKFSRKAVGQTARALGNRDRGTITEYFRGMCFEQVVLANFDVEAAARALAGTAEQEVVARVQAKIEEYLANLRAARGSGSANDRGATDQACKGLPKKYHVFVQRIRARWELQ